MSIGSLYQYFPNKEAILANCATIAHEPDEMLRMPFNTDEIPYNWDLRQG